MRIWIVVTVIWLAIGISVTWSDRAAYPDDWVAPNPFDQFDPPAKGGSKFDPSTAQPAPAPFAWAQHIEMTLLPPFVLLAAGFAFIWVAQGFKTE